MKIFGVEKFKSLLVAGSFTVLAGYIVRLADAVIAGNLIGENALAGVNLAGPVLSIISFVGGMIATGVATNYSLSMGRCEQQRARQYFTQGVWSVVIFGGLLSAVIFFGRGAFLSFMGASDAINVHASDYLGWIWPLAILQGVEELLVAMGYADGDSKLCMAAYVAIFAGNVIGDVVFIKAGLGTAGCAYGSMLAEVLGIAVMSAHFFRRGNTLAFVRHFSPSDSLRIFGASFGDAAAFLCDGLLFFFINKFVIVVFGSEVLPVVSVATTLWGFLEFFNGVGVAIQPIVTVYYGEGNTKSVRTVMRSAMSVSVIEGVVFMLFFGLFPQLTIKVVGITDPHLVDMAVTSIRLMCGGFVALAFAGLFNSYYMFIERPMLAGCVTFLCYLIAPIACIACGSLLGLTGLWAGLGMGPFLGLAITSLVIFSTVDRSMYPLLLSCEREENLFVFNLRLVESEIVEVSRKIERLLTERGRLPSQAIRAALMTEEVFMVVKDRAGGRRLMGEVTLNLDDDGVTMTLRDDGEIFDITDADAKISSLRTFLVASMMLNQRIRLNLATSGFNRNVFRF